MTHRPQGNRRFRVALISDTHCNADEDRSASPYRANAQANPRARHAFGQIARSGAAFAIHLGDMVNPVPERPDYAASVAAFHAITAGLGMDLHLMPGNHDVGDKPVSWMPAGTVDADTLALYRAHFGPDRKAVRHEGCRFILLNSPLINTGLPDEAEQAAWAEAEMAEAKAAGERVFLFTHYPPYVSDPDEPGSYDNIDPPGRGWLLGLIRRHQPEAVFAGHVHNFWYDRIGPTAFYILPSTCFVRHDYGELYRGAPPDAEQGRDEGAKLGHVSLDIHEAGHVLHWHRSYGATSAPDAPPPPPPPARPHASTTCFNRVLVDLRHPWAEVLEVSPSGAVDEFGRKRARNDWPVLALWEAGLRGMRIPVQDVTDPAVARRVRLMAEAGQRFQVYRYGLPDAAEVAALAALAPHLTRLELVLDWDGLVAQLPALAEVRKATGLPVVLSRVNRRDAAKTAGGHYNHLISHSFALSELDEITAFLAARPGAFEGVQVAIPRSVHPDAAAARLAEFAAVTGAVPVLYVKSTEASPAEAFTDDVANARRMAEAVLAASRHGVDVVLDTLDDIDRGYFTRTGLTDRRFNPRLAGMLVAEVIRQIDAGDAAVARLRVGPPSEVPAGARWTDPACGASGDADDLTGGESALLVIVDPG